MTTPHAINGTDLSTFATIVRFGALHAPATYSGSDLAIPYLAGEVPGNRTRRGRDYAMDLRVKALTEADYNAKAAGLVDLIEADGETFTLSRTVPGAGAQTALARYDSGGTVVRVGALPGAYMGLCSVVFRLLDGRFA